MKTSIITLVAVLLLASCGKSGSSGSSGGNPIPTPASPVAAVLTSPEQNETCTTGTIISATESAITFNWNASANTTGYQLNLTNLLTKSTTTQNSASASMTVTLLRNTPYSWYIVSTSSKTSATATSETWKFYNSGPGVVTYPPFPADITSPVFGQEIATATVNLTWTGSITSRGVIANYDVYFGTTDTPPLFKGALTSSSLNGVSVTSGNTYYWKVITRDANGDTSDSGLYQFSVK